MTRALFDRLAVCFSVAPAADVMGNAGAWESGAAPTGGEFGAPFDDVRSIVLHQTGGWPARGRVGEFVDRYIKPPTTPAALRTRGVGPHFYVSGDGTAFRIIDVPRVTFHGTFVNAWSLGVEIGNLFRTAPPPGSAWKELGADVLGARGFVRDHAGPPPEVVVGWWTTPAYRGPRREPSAAPTMLFSDAEYRALARLARWMCEVHGVPRQVPLFPHALRTAMIDDDGDTLRRIALAEPACDRLLAAWAPFGVGAAELASKPAFTARYQAAVHALGGGLKRHNQLWHLQFQSYRGFHGHGYSGAVLDGRSDHDCPGPMFDWHRFARALWDWWWMPFDLGAARRPYQRPDRKTPLVEYWFDEDEAARRARVRGGCHGAASAPDTFAVPVGTPVYAMANGHLVAARLGPTDAATPSDGFALVRHELFHAAAPHAHHGGGALDYATAPTAIYTLYWHLGSADLDDLAPGNPDWLDRVLARLRECERGAAFAADDQTIPASHWQSVPPGEPARPGLLAGWKADREFLRGFVERLRAGQVAVGPRGPGLTPIDVLLGDHLGGAGVCAIAAGAAVGGVRVEAFANVRLPGFTEVAAWTSDPMQAVRGQSEHARLASGDEAAALIAHGFAPPAAPWWPAVADDPGLPPDARLPADGVVWHHRALDVARWINDLTWKHERGKYRSPAAAAMARPPSRRR